jgi:hypothetical protein
MLPAAVDRGLYSRPVADQTLRLPDAGLHERLAAAIDREGKIPRALDALGPIADRRVVVLDAEEGLRTQQLRDLGGTVTPVAADATASLPDASADVVVAMWSAIRPGEEAAASQVGEAMRVLDPSGRLLVVHDYGRDDVSGLLGGPERVEQLLAWSHRNGPFLVNGFKLRVLHCWWSWDDLDEATALLREAFGEAGGSVAESMRRPRLSYKVAVYHRDHEAAQTAPGAAA